MKKTILLLALLLSSIFYGQEDRELNVGLNVGLPVGDVNTMSSFAFGIEGNYLFDDWFEDFKIGPTLGVLYFSGKENEGGNSDGFTYLPVGGAFRFQAFEELFHVGVDFGYAVAISPSGDRGGIYFKPRVGYNINDSLKINLSYSAVKKRQVAYGYIGLGLEYGLFENRY